MPTLPKQVTCANCRRKQPDLGRRATCEYCGCFPLPSYAYARSSSFHPERCGCTTDKAPPVQINYRKRITPEPQLKL